MNKSEFHPSKGCLNKGDLMILTALHSASARTKNRLREHGPGFTETKRVQSSRALGDCPAILVHSALTEWFGWLPLNEITIAQEG